MAYLLSLVPLLACPVGMGLMMWVMMRGNKGHATREVQMPAQNAASRRTSADVDPDKRLAMLRDHLAAVQEQQSSIAAQIRQLSAEDYAAEPYDAVERPIHVGR